MAPVTSTGLENVAEAKAVIERSGLDVLVVNALTFDDLDQIAWSGEPRHRVAVSEALSRVASGDVEYLAVRVPSGGPVAKVGIDFARYRGSGYLWQFATHPELQGLGIGSFLLAAAEARIITRGLRLARINVEDENPRARQLYERLGYAIMGRDTETWERVDVAGGITLHRAEVTLMGKQLS
jgi:ribosomal protein S18 acetylase RimI-like enzyme